MNIFRRAAHLLTAQRQLIEQRNREIVDLQRLVMAAQHSMLDLAIGFRLAIESPEVDISEELDALINDLSNSLAVIEEYVL